jgi:hypothetical protein
MLRLSWLRARLENAVTAKLCRRELEALSKTDQRVMLWFSRRFAPPRYDHLGCGLRVC